MEKTFQKIFCIGIFVLLFEALLLLFFSSMSFDEAWLLSHYKEISEGRIFAYKMAPNSLTAGGMFTLLNAGLFRLFGPHLWVFRFVSFSAFLGILMILWRWFDLGKESRFARWLGLSVFLGMTGSVELSALAFADFFGMFFLLLGLGMLREKQGGLTTKRCLFLGACIGIAASARLNLLSIFPACLLEILLFSTPSREKWKQGLLIFLSGITLFFLAESAVVYLAPENMKQLVEDSIEFIGWREIWLDYPRMLNKWIVANGFLPFYLMVAASIFIAIDRSPSTRLWRTLVLFGWIHWSAWMLRAPIPHLRYLWPSLAAFGVVGGAALASLFHWAQYERKSCLRVGAALVGCALLVQAAVCTFRSILFGDVNILTWEWSRETALQDFRWYRAGPNQRKIADYVATHHNDEKPIGAMGIDLETEMLSGVTVVPLEFYFSSWNPNALPKKLLVNPMIGTYIYFSPELFVWMQKNLQLEAQFGGYVLYNVVGRYPDHPDIFKHSRTPYPQLPLAKPSL